MDHRSRSRPCTCSRHISQHGEALCLTAGKHSHHRLHRISGESRHSRPRRSQQNRPLQGNSSSMCPVYRSSFPLLTRSRWLTAKRQLITQTKCSQYLASSFLFIYLFEYGPLVRGADKLRVPLQITG